MDSYVFMILVLSESILPFLHDISHPESHYSIRTVSSVLRLTHHPTYTFHSVENRCFLALFLCQTNEGERTDMSEFSRKV